MKLELILETSYILNLLAKMSNVQCNFLIKIENFHKSVENSCEYISMHVK